MNFPTVDDQLAVIRRGIEKIVPENELGPRLDQSRRTGRPLRIKYGIDPTGIDVHLGHTVPLRKLRQFQELGHTAVIIIGNFTALVGDPSGRDHARSRRLSEDEVERNARDYLAQVGKVVDLSRAEVRRNGDWFAPMPFAQMLQLVARVTVAQLLTRDDFAKRYAAQSPIHLHECLYPVMQAFDSVVVAADVELGGTEQLYSFMLARDLQKDAGVCALASSYQTPGERACLLADGTLPPQIGVMSPILVGLDGVRRMGKSLGNYIGIAEAPYEMMKKFMQIPDALLLPYYELLTDVPLAEARAQCESDPRNAKLRLAERVIASFHAPGEAGAAAERWQKEISQGALPEQIPEAELGRELLDGEGRIQAAALLKSTGLAPSTSEAVRLIQGGSAFYYRGDERVRIADRQEWIAVAPGMIVGVGKKRIARLRLRD